MIYKTTKRCDQDIIDIYVRGEARFGLGQAERYHAGLLATFELLAANPRLARLRYEFRPPVRLHPYGAHVIFYVEAPDVTIVRVLHGRQDWKRHL